MGTGWRRALCTSVQRDDDDAKNAKTKKRRPPQDAAAAPSPRAGGGFFSAVKSGGGSSGPSTPALRCRTRPPPQQPAEGAPVAPPPSAPAPAAARKEKHHRVPLLQALSAPASPRSPSRFALLKASLLPSKSRCGVCSRGVKNGGSAAVFTAECSHAFHFPCIAAHARSSASAAAGVLSCPVCASPWRQAPFLASLRLHCSSSFHDDKHLHHHRGGTKAAAPSPAPGPAAAGPKLYDDDEPLMAPKAAANGGGGGGFNPIPEADDENDYEAAEAAAAEFRGFFPGRPARASSGPAVTVAPEAALVSSGRRHGRYVVAVKVRAPGPLAAPRRAPIDLVTVLDVSQGMVGEKLQALKRGMRLVVASLGPADRLAIVAFSGAAKRLLPLRRMTRTGQRSARQIVDRLVVCAAAATAIAQGQDQEQPLPSSASVGDALRKATKVLEDRRDRNPVATVMLLSDTQQQQQPDNSNSTTTRKQFGGGRPAVAPATRFTHVEIPIGPGDVPPLVAAEEEEMGESEPPVEHAFAKCLGGLVSVVMQEVHLELAFPAGEITAVFQCGQQAAAVTGGGAGLVSVRLGEMYAEEERELMVEVRVPLAQGGHPHALSARCSYRDPASQEAVHGTEQPLLLPLLQASSRRLHDLFVATRAVAEARRLAELQDLATAVHLLSSARALLLQSPPTQQRQELLGSLDTELSDMRWRRSRQQTEQPPTPTSSRSGRRRGDGGETAMPVGTPRGVSGSGSSAGGPSEPLTPTSAWRAAEQLAKVAIMRKSMNRVSDLHGFENARF